jgi:hypothetical protein
VFENDLRKWDMDIAAAERVAKNKTDCRRLIEMASVALHDATLQLL